MPRPNQTFRLRRLTPLVFGFSLLIPAAALFAQQPGTEPPATPYLETREFPADRMPAADADLVRAKQKEILKEAAFFGYDLSSGNWGHDEILCPEIPDQLLLHYRSQSRSGAVSLFTALVPRGEGRVLIVPVLYRGAMPFHSAIGSERTIAVFNRIVPAEVAAQAMQPDGHWLALAVCYAEIAGAEPRVPQRPDIDPALVQAPLPTLQLSEQASTRDILFTDRKAADSYLVWRISVSKQGRVLAASTRSLPNYTAKEPGGKEPREKIVSPGAEPKWKTVPAGQPPAETPTPQ